MWPGGWGEGLREDTRQALKSSTERKKCSVLAIFPYKMGSTLVFGKKTTATKVFIRFRYNSERIALIPVIFHMFAGTIDLRVFRCKRQDSPVSGTLVRQFSPGSAAH